MQTAQTPTFRPLTLTSHLSEREVVVLRLLARGNTYQEIAGLLHITLANVHTTACHMRQKTGILDSRNPQECMDYIRGRHPGADARLAYGDGDRTKPVYPTPRQLEVMRLVAQGTSYAQIALRLGMGLQTVQNAACQGSRRAGLPRSHGLSREHAIRDYLSRLDAERLAAGRTGNGHPHGADPLDEF